MLENLQSKGFCFAAISTSLQEVKRRSQIHFTMKPSDSDSVLRHALGQRSKFEKAQADRSRRAEGIRKQIEERESTYDQTTLLVEKGDLVKATHIPEELQCKCVECVRNTGRPCLKPKVLVQRDPTDKILLRNVKKFSVVNDYDFLFVLKRLSPLREAIRNIKLNIPDTVGFSKGEPSFIAFTAKVPC